jgi:hypothetical protein
MSTSLTTDTTCAGELAKIVELEPESAAAHADVTDRVLVLTDPAGRASETLGGFVEREEMPEIGLAVDRHLCCELGDDSRDDLVHQTAEGETDFAHALAAFKTG